MITPGLNLSYKTLTRGTGCSGKLTLTGIADERGVTRQRVYRSLGSRVLTRAAWRFRSQDGGRIKGPVPKRKAA